MNEDCPICYDPFEPNGNNVSKTSCGHQFHTNCILQIRNGTCPICRNRLVNDKPKNDIEEHVRQNNEYNRIMEEADELIRIHHNRQHERELQQRELEHRAELRLREFEHKRKLDCERRERELEYKAELRLREFERKLKQREYNNRTYFASSTVDSDHSDEYTVDHSFKSINKKNIKSGSMDKIKNKHIRLIDQ